MRIAKSLVTALFVFAVPLGCLGLLSGCDSGGKDGSVVELRQRSPR